MERSRDVKAKTNRDARVAAGEPRYLVGTTNGETGFIVYDDDYRTTVLKTRTRKEAEQIAARFEIATPTHTRHHIPEDRHPRLGLPDMSVKEAAVQSHKSTDWVIRRFRDEPGVRRDGNPQRQVLTIPVAVFNRVMNRMTVK